MKVCDYLSMPYGIETVRECVYRKSSPSIEKLVIGIDDNKSMSSVTSKSTNGSPKNASKSSNSTSNKSKHTRKTERRNGYVRVLESEYNMLLESHSKIEKIKEVLHHSKDFSWCTSHLSRRLLAMAIVFVPTLSCACATKLYIFFYIHFFIKSVSK